MNLGTAVACLPSSRNIYSINPDQTSTTTSSKPVNKRRSIIRSRPRSKSHQLESIKEQHVLYSHSSQDCPCEHHRLSRLREDSHKNFDDIISASFEASLAPFRGLLTPSTSTGDSGVNTNSNGSQRSSGRAVREREFSGYSSSSSNSGTSSDLDAVVTTTVIGKNKLVTLLNKKWDVFLQSLLLKKKPTHFFWIMNNCFDESFSVEQNGCEDNSPQSNSKKESDFWQRNNRIITQQRSDLIQVRIA